MPMTMNTKRALVVIAAIIAAGCNGQTRPSATPPPPQTAAELKNPTDFPLAPDAKILDVKPFSQTIASTSSNSQGSSFTSQGSGTYTGNEVLASSTMSSKELQGWLAQLGEK